MPSARFAEQPSPDGVAWVIALKDTGAVIGWFGISNPADPPRAFNVNFEYALARPLEPGVYDRGATRVMEKAGMRFTHASRGPDQIGTWWDHRHYRITRAEYRATLEGMSPEWT